MLWRMVFPLVMMFTPRLVPRVVRTAYLVWKLIWDGRVPLLLRLLVPATLIYFLTPFARIPMVGLVGFILLLLLAVFVLFNLAPREVVEEHAPWRASRRPEGRSEKGSSRIVEGSHRLENEEEGSK